MSTEAFRLEPEFSDEDYEPVPEQGYELAMEETAPLSVEAVTIASHMGRITKKLDAEMLLLEQTGIALAQTVNAINPTDQASYVELCERLNDNKAFLEKVDEFIEPWKKLFYRPYQAILERAKTLVSAPALSHMKGKERRLQFEREAKAAQERETLRLQNEQKQREEEARLATAVKAEELGLSEQAVETILTQPSVAPTPVAAPMISRPQGVRKIPPNWQAELADPAAFWKWAKSQREMPPMLLIDGPTMNREAKTHRAMLGQKYPGFRGVNKGGD